MANRLILNKKDDEWKFNSVSKYLKGSALTLFVTDCLNCGNYILITEILTEKFIKVNVPNFSVFTNSKLESICNLEYLFNKKGDTDRKLELSENLILQVLTNGLKDVY